jgi:hypothetical protein
MTSQFHEFLDFIFGGILQFGVTVNCCCCGSMVCRRIAEYPYSQHSSTIARQLHTLTATSSLSWQLLVVG